MSGRDRSLYPQVSSERWSPVRTSIVPLNPFREFIDLLQDMFPLLILQDQDCFAGEAGAEDLLALLPGGAQIDSLRRKWTADPNRSSEDKWDDIRNQVKIHGKKSAPGVSLPLDAKRFGDDLIWFS